MRLKHAAWLAGFWLASTGAGHAQIANGYEVQVNPIPPAGGVLLYPGGQYMRVVPRLKQPGDTGGPITLHMPSKRRHIAAARPPVAPPPAAASDEQPAPAPKHVARAAPPKPAAGPPPIPGYVPLNSAANLFGGAPAPSQPAAPPPSQPAAPPRAQVARAEPAPTQTNGSSKRSMILFAAGAPDPSKDSLGAIRFLAGDLNSALGQDASARIQLQAFGGAKGDKGSDARRLSLKRALAIRQVLIDDGISPDRINVSAMGGADEGPPDRVDVYLKS